MPERTETLFDLLARTTGGDPVAERALAAPRLRACIEDAERGAGIGGDSPEALYRIARFGLAEAVDRFPAPPMKRQNYWEACNSWLVRLAGALGTDDAGGLGAVLPRPVTGDTGIELIKALHGGEKTKEELAGELSVSEKTIQTGLRALCPKLQQGGEAPPPLRVGGQVLRAEVEETREGGKKRYRMSRRLHPVVLQWNTLQICRLLQGLYRFDAAAGSQGDAVCLDGAIDVWSQLSEEGRERIKEIYRDRDPGFYEFLRNVESCTEDWEHVFRQEEDYRSGVSPRLRLDLAFKGGSTVRLILLRDGQERKLLDMRLDWRGGDEWYAIPREEWPAVTHAIRFRAEEVKTVESLEK